MFAATCNIETERRDFDVLEGHLEWYYTLLLLSKTVIDVYSFPSVVAMCVI